MIFGQAPREGETFTIEGRIFVCEGSGPHTTRVGKTITLIHWRCDCAQCGAAYSFKTPLDVSRGAKRCRKCIDAQPIWNSRWLTPGQKKQKAIERASKNGKISAGLKAHHDSRLGRNRLGLTDD